MINLTPRQAEVVERVAAGEQARQIAKAMGIKSGTVYRHLDDARSRAGCDTTVTLCVEYIRQTRQAK